MTRDGLMKLAKSHSHLPNSSCCSLFWGKTRGLLTGDGRRETGDERRETRDAGALDGRRETGDVRRET